MNTLIDAMLDLSRMTRHPLRVKDVDLFELLTSVQVELTAEQGARLLEWRVEPLPLPLPLLSADRHLLRQVMVNLLSNAVQYTRNCAQAVIEVRAKERPGGWAVLVRDNGVGFDPRSLRAGCSRSSNACTMSARPRAPGEGWPTFSFTLPCGS
ncbi:hypothetical protein DESA109040_08530 [Deinococcus saxicola]|uniref:ATP-binding protein n=1 Tax=Deinococcus saxicola TaxID=249406 RepID=UPI0039EE9060